MSLLQSIIDNAVTPALALLPDNMDSVPARIMMLAIGLQESRFEHRRQIGGPAMGFWQFERGGGVRGVLTHSTSRDHAIAICEERGVVATAEGIYGRLDHDDVLAAAFARLLLWTDPYRLPAVGDAQAAWDLYVRTWRPGKPHRETWGALYAQTLREASP